MDSNNQMSQHKRMAMGEKVGFKSGGTVSGSGPGPGPSAGKMRPLKTGTPMPPQTVAKQQNGIPGFKKGGKKGK